MMNRHRGFTLLKKKQIFLSGFTLIEMMVAIALFVIVALVVTTALLNISAVNRENAAVKLALENMGLVFDTLRPAIWNMKTEEGTDCATLGGACDINAGTLTFKYTAEDKNTKTFKMTLDTTTGTGKIMYTANAGTDDLLPITTSDIIITKLRFSMSGSHFVRVRVIIEGQVPVRGSMRTFTMQSTFTSSS